MVNEWKEYLDYTGTMSYTSTGKPDSTWRGRFSFEAFEDLHGFNRILAIIARRYLFHNADGSLLLGETVSVQANKNGPFLNHLIKLLFHLSSSIA